MNIADKLITIAENEQKIYNKGAEKLRDLIQDRLKEISDDEITFIKYYAFSACSALTSVNFPNATRIGKSAFNSCIKLHHISLPKVKDYPSEEDSSTVFQYCTKLISADLPELSFIGQYMFRYCNSLTTVNTPEATAINYGAFIDCSSLAEVQFPKVSCIKQYAFLNCVNLKKLILPYNPNNNSISVLENVSVFENTPIAKGTGYIYVPDNLVSTYKTATNWSVYASQIKGISELEG